MPTRHLRCALIQSTCPSLFVHWWLDIRPIARRKIKTQSQMFHLKHHNQIHPSSYQCCKLEPKLQQRTVTNFIDKGRTEPFPKFQASFGVPPAENCDKLYWKRKDRTVPKDPRSFRFLTVICDDVPPERIIYLESIRKVRRLNREPWLNTSKKARLNRCHSPKPLFVFSEQKMVTNDIEKEMTPLFLKTQASFRFPSVRPSLIFCCFFINSWSKNAFPKYNKS